MDLLRRVKARCISATEWLEGKPPSHGYPNSEAHMDTFGPVPERGHGFLRFCEALFGLSALRYESFRAAGLHGDRRGPGTSRRRPTVPVSYTGNFLFSYIPRKVIMDDNRVLVVVVGLLGVSAIFAFTIIMVFYQGDKSVALAGLTALIGLLIPNLLVLRQGAVAARLADVAAVNAAEGASKANSVAEEIRKVHQIVNGEKTQLLSRVASLESMLTMERKVRSGAEQELAAMKVAVAVDKPIGQA